MGVKKEEKQRETKRGGKSIGGRRKRKDSTSRTDELIRETLVGDTRPRFQRGVARSGVERSGEAGQAGTFGKVGSSMCVAICLRKFQPFGNPRWKRG